jgi:6-phosphogluconolactonase
MAKDSVTFEAFDDAGAVAAAAAHRILIAARRSIAERGRFLLVLAGGGTPLDAYSRLVGEAADWDRWHIFFGDERCVAADDRARNSLAAAQAFLDRVSIPLENRHLIPVERGADAAAAAYQAEISPLLPFDLVLLGMGEDGHTASLFPGHPVPDGALVIPVAQSPKPPPERVSLTPLALASGREMLILVTGAAKRGAYAAWRTGADLPVARVAALGGAHVLFDRAAAGGAG